MASPAGQWIRSQLETRFGVTLAGVEEVQALRESYSDFMAFREEASELAIGVMDYASGRPQDMRPEARQRLAQRSRVALMVDPLAGAEADLRANFAFGRGVPMPDAEDTEVQQIIKEAWTDPVNQEKLTSFEAQQFRSRQMLAQANLFPTAYVKNGRVRLGFLDADRVLEAICHPEDEERPLFYAYRPKTRSGRVEWDFTAGRWKTADFQGGVSNGLGSDLVYFAHWRNLEDAQAEDKANRANTIGDVPSGEQLNPGLVYHARINRISGQFGTPPFARTLRFMSAMNELTEAHVAMAQARSTFIAKRTRIQAPSQMTQAANSILTQTGEIGAANFGENTFGHGQDPRLMPPPPGSFWLENPSDKLEGLNLSSGAGEAMQTAQIVRAPISASMGFQQGYLGDAQNAGSLAAATALELPTLMNVQAWQETFEQILRWFVDLVLREAVRAGRLGDQPAKATMGLALSELNLQEADQRQEAERRTGKTLDYRITSPYPGRRNLPDVTTSVTGLMTAIPGGGRSAVLVEKLLTFFFSQGLQSEDPKADAEATVADLEKVWQQMDQLQQQQMAAQAAASPAGGAGGSAGGNGGGGSSGPPSPQPSPSPNGQGDQSAGATGVRGGSSGGAMSEQQLEDLWTLEVEEPVLGAVLNGGEPVR